MRAASPRLSCRAASAPRRCPPSRSSAPTSRSLRLRASVPHFATAVSCAIALASASCSRRPEDIAAKARIFSPEEPPGTIAGAADKLDAQRLAEDPALAARVLQMPRDEIGARLGAYKAQTRVQFTWFRGSAAAAARAGAGAADGGQPDAAQPADEIQLSEESALAQAANGDFSVKLSNDHNSGYEIIWVLGEVFERGLFGPYRKRRTDRTDPDRLRAQAMAALPTFDRLARGLKLRLEGETHSGGRRAIRYSVAGFGAQPARAEDSQLPPVRYPEPAEPAAGPAAQAGRPPAPDPDTARRLELFAKEQPEEISGTLLVDAETAAPLACDLKGRFAVASSGAASSRGAPAAELDLHAVLATTAVGGAIGLKAPAFEPDPSVPHAVKDPLRFLGRTAQPGAPSSENATEGEPDDGE